MGSSIEGTSVGAVVEGSVEGASVGAVVEGSVVVGSVVGRLVVVSLGFVVFSVVSSVVSSVDSSSVVSSGSLPVLTKTAMLVPGLTCSPMC